MKKIFTFFLCLSFMGTATSQITVFQKALDRDFGTNNSIGDYGYSVKQTFDNGYIVAGYTDGYGIGQDDIYLILLNEAGDTLWSKIYGGTLSERARDVLQTSDSGFVITGETKSVGNGNHEFFLMKVDKNGYLLWSKGYGGNSHDLSYQVKPTADGGFIMIGETESFGQGWEDILIIKTDNNGDTLWTKIYGGTSTDIARDIQQTTDGGYIVVGDESSFDNGVLLMKLDANGDTLWNKTYRENFSAYEGYSVVQTTDGGYIVGANTYDGGIGYRDMMLFKTDANGVVSWTKTYGTVNNDQAVDVKETSDGGYLIGGNTTPNTYTNLIMIKTDGTGAVSWHNTYVTAYNNEGYEVLETSDGGFATAGYVYNNLGNTLAAIYAGYDAMVVKTDANGNAPGCIKSNTVLSTSTLNLSSYGSQFVAVSGLSVTNANFTQQSTKTVNTDVKIKLNLSSTSVTCGAGCNGTTFANPCDSMGFYCSGQNPYSYAWNDPSNQVTATASGLCAGTYTVTVTDQNGCKGTDSITITTSAPLQDICLVTVDTTSTHNVIAWEKPVTDGIESFNVYRNIVGTYTLIGNVPYDSLSLFTDTTNGINPFITSYRYKISTLDTCGNESTLSNYHKSIHLQVSTGVGGEANLLWDAYEGFSFPYYRIWRKAGIASQWQLIDSVLNTNFTYTDPTPPQVPVISYRVEVVASAPCTSTKAVSFNSSRSNKPTISGVGALNADFSTNTTTILEGQTITFNDNSTGNPITWNWVFSGGTPATSTAQNPGVIYSIAGTYDVNLTITDGNSFDSYQQTSYITVLTNNGMAPAAEFIGSSTVINAGEAVSFTDLSSNSPTSWSWVFSNGTPSSSTDKNPQNIVYNTPGTYAVSLSTSNINGSDNEVKTNYITVNAIAPGINEPELSSMIRIYPNPGNGSFTIDLPAELIHSKVEIFNALGQRVSLFENKGDVSHIYQLDQPGVYNVQIRTNNQSLVKKVVVN